MIKPFVNAINLIIYQIPAKQDFSFGIYSSADVKYSLSHAFQ